MSINNFVIILHYNNNGLNKWFLDSKLDESCRDGKESGLDRFNLLVECNKTGAIYLTSDMKKQYDKYKQNILWKVTGNKLEMEQQLSSKYDYRFLDGPNTLNTYSYYKYILNPKT